MEGLELTSFKIIAAVGSAKSKFVEAYQETKDGNFDKAEICMQEGEEFLLQGHKVHMELVQKEASGEKIEFQLLLMHAEDQFMSTETIKYVVEELIELRKDLRK